MQYKETKRFSRLWFMLFWMLGGVGCLFSQSPDHTQYSLDNGLASSIVYSAIQDRDGFIWFATESGVSRFDGTHFQNFTVGDGLVGNDVLRLYEDHKGRIWCLSFNPQVCYFENGQIHNPKTDPWLDAVKARNFFPALIEDGRGDIWLAGDNGKLIRLNADRKEVNDSVFPELLPTSLWGFFLDKDRQAVAVCNSFAHPLTKGATSIPIQPTMPRWLAPRIGNISDQAVITAMANQATLFLNHSAYPLRLPPEFDKADILSVTLDREQNLWFGTRDGALMLSDFVLQDTTIRYSKVRKFLPGRTITSILEDHEGNHWLTSLGEGVFFFSSIHAITYQPFPEIGNAFANKVFVDSKGDVWVGFDKNIYAKLTHGNMEIHQLPRGANGRGRMNDIFEDQDGNIFLATDESVVIIDRSGKTHYHQPYAKAIAQVPNGDYYVSHGWQVNRIKNCPPAQFEQAYALARSSHDHHMMTRATSLATTAEGKLLLGTLHGLFEAENGILKQIEAVPAVPISHIKVVPNGRVWLSTLNSGIGYLENEKFHPVAPDLMNSDICHDITIDAAGIVHIATNRGITRLEPLDAAGTTFRSRSFGKSYGLASDEVRSVATDNGKVYVATAKGLTVIDAAFLTGNQPAVRLHAKAFTASGKELSLNGETLQLPADDNQFSLLFTGISYRNANNVQYRYVLSKDNEVGEWNATSSRRLDFPYLSPGKYKLGLEAMIEGLPSTTDKIEFHFEVLPAFWETSLARILVFLLLLGCVLLIFWLVLRRRKAQERKRAGNNKRIAELEHKALRAQMNPHFIFNSLNSIERFYITDRMEEANTFIADFSELMRAILDLSAKPFILLSEELRLVELFLTLESHRMDHRFDFDIEVAPEIDPEVTYVPPLILQPFVENSIWHGVSALENRKGNIQILVGNKAEGIQVTIRDNGIGRKKSEELKSKYRKKHTSSGIRITKERFELLNLDLEGKMNYQIEFHDLVNEDDIGIGTDVVISLPNAFNDNLQ
jgi:ligand-binding sensor domain-containing protein